MSELKPCPFCGGSALLRGFAVDEAMHWWVACENCGATSGELLAESTPDRDFAVESWNRRTTPQPVTPAGGEVEPFGYFDSQGLSHAGNSTTFRWLLEQHREGKPNWGDLKLLYTHPPVADAALDTKRLDWMEQEVASKSAVWLLTAADQRFVQVRTVDGIDNCPLAPTVRAAIDAALNQRGGGDHG